MLHNITWAQYFIAIGLAMLLYYIAIILLYYRDEAIRFIRREPRPLSPGTAAPTAKATNKEEIIDGLESVVADLAGILRKAGSERSKPALLQELSGRLRGYPGLKNEVFRLTITNYIIRHAKSLCGHEYSPAELNNEWESLIRQQ